MTEKEKSFISFLWRMLSNQLFSLKIIYKRNESSIYCILMNSIPEVTKWMKGKFLIKVVLQLIRTRGIK